MRIATKCLVLLAAFAGLGASLPARAEVLIYDCHPWCLKSDDCTTPWQFDPVVAGTDQQRVVFPHAGPDTQVGAALAAPPDKIRLATRVTPQLVSFEFWTTTGGAYGHMTIQRSNGDFHYQLQVDRDVKDRMAGKCRLEPVPSPAQLARAHLSGIH